MRDSFYFKAAGDIATETVGGCGLGSGSSSGSGYLGRCFEGAGSGENHLYEADRCAGFGGGGVGGYEDAANGSGFLGLGRGAGYGSGDGAARRCFEGGNVDNDED